MVIRQQRLSLAALAALLLGIWLMAMAAMTPARAQAEDASAFIEALNQEVLAAMREEDRSAALGVVFTRTFDVDTIARWALGRHWVNASEAQRAEYIELFRQYVVATYSGWFTDYQGGNFKVESARAVTPDESLVNTEVARQGRYKTRLVFHVQKMQRGWTVIDVIVDGISLVNVKRAEFDSVVRKGGIDELLARLRAVVVTEYDEPSYGTRVLLTLAAAAVRSKQ
jgi:phospholipid transport system substrate-binding protein